MSLRVLSRLRVVLCLVLLCALFPYPASSARGSFAGVDILSSSAWTAGWLFMIVGEVRNNTTDNVSAVRISAVYYDGEGAVIGTSAGYALHDILVPGSISPFTVWGDPLPGYASYALSVEYSTTTGQPVPQLTILNTREWVQSGGSRTFVGEVQNTTASMLRNVKPIITLYDQTGTVTNVLSAVSLIEILEPGQKAPFSLASGGPTDYVTRSFSTNAEFTTDLPPNLRTVGLAYYTDLNSRLHFAGQVQNLEAVAVLAPAIVLTLYDVGGLVLTHGWAYTDHYPIPAGGTAPFDLRLSEHFAAWTDYAIYPPEGVLIPTQTPTNTSTASPTPTQTSPPTATATRTPSPTATSTRTNTPTATLTRTSTSTATSTSTPSPTATLTRAPPRGLYLPLVRR